MDTLTPRTGAPSRASAVATALLIDGWLTPDEAGMLYDLAKRSIGPIVELGSFRGRSTTAMALGSMAGGNQPVYAVDSFIGDGGKDCSPELLRANLDRSGVNGLVWIVPKTSQEAACDVPDCGLLFVDGSHDYTSVARDLDLYLPRLVDGGIVVLHDVTADEPGVVQAVDEQLTAHPQDWLILRRVDSTIIAQKQQAVSHKVGLGFPGPNLSFDVAKNLFQASLGTHTVSIYNSGNGWDDMNVVWTQALNAFEAGEITHFAMLHSDIIPEPGWLDVLLHELQATGASLVSAVAPIKDRRGLTSCGIGDLSFCWGPFRRFTVRETLAYPETFSIDDTEYAGQQGKYLLNNTGCWACDLRNPLFRQADADGLLIPTFNFPVVARRNAEGKWISERESEDWYFSRQVYLLGAKACATTKVQLYHRGTADFPNYGEWGTFVNGDEQTSANWRQP